MQPAYAGELAARGVVTLAIDSWCFGGRQHKADGQTGEYDTFKLMHWRGQTLWGMMMLDELRALDYLAGRPEVDGGRLGAFGMSMGATKAWWLAALDERVKVCIDLCCLTDFEELIRIDNLKGHGLYYFVPGLL
ncbi:MAG: acetylxylan esterase, partial [Acidobacteria bacterium]|nr:acetylxylan esterase [Acidobacteriota bacterium]